MQPELQTIFARSVVEYSVDEGHDGSLETQVIAIGACASVQLVHDALEAGTLARVFLEVDHGF